MVLAAVMSVLLFPALGNAGEVVGRGDFEFYLDGAAFRMQDGSTRQHIYLRIPSASVRFKAVAGKYEANPRVSIRIRDANGKTVVEDSNEMVMHAKSEMHALDPLKFHTLTKSYSLPEGVYRLSCKIVDRNAPKVTIMGMVRNKYRESLISAYPLEVPTFPSEEISLSDAKFVWSIGHRGDEATYVPNPARMYGLYRDSLNVFIEAYVPRSIASSSSQDFKIQTVILDQNDSTLTTSSVVVPRTDPTDAESAALATFPILITKDLNRYMAGKYTLYVDVLVEDKVRVHRLAGHFSVTWDMRSWEISRRNLVAEARFLLEADDFRGFYEKTPGEQEAIVSAMWKEIDPDPATGVNEAYEKYLERVAYIEAMYTDYQLGIFSDRGLIYLKYGPPDEKIVDVIPLNRESLSDALMKVEDRYHAVNFSNTGGRPGYATPQQNIVIDPRRLGAVGEGGDTASPYELWIYNQNGDPIRKRDESIEPDQGLRFIFVDREGYGRYRLESSSSMGQ